MLAKDIVFHLEIKFKISQENPWKKYEAAQ